MGRSAQLRPAFSLVELLVVIGVLAILFSIVLAVSTGVFSQSDRAQAKAEMALLSQALAAYKAHHGDYPRLTRARGEYDLYAALIGNQGYNGNSLNPKGPHFVELAKMRIGRAGFNVETDAPIVPTPSMAGGVATNLDSGFSSHFFIDPWGNPYVYYYAAAGAGVDGAWDSPGFVLISAGEDGRQGILPPPSGILPADFRNTDDAHDDLIFPE